MTEEFNLSKELIWIESLKEFVVLESRLKEFIRLLKEEIKDVRTYVDALEVIDKLAGDKLK